jgi:hypothetical protein
MPRAGRNGAWPNFRDSLAVRTRQQGIRGICEKCGRPLGYLAPMRDEIEWYGSEYAGGLQEIRGAPIRQDIRHPDRRYRAIADGRRRARCVRKCGATPVYTQTELRARYERARAAGQRTAAL